LKNTRRDIIAISSVFCFLIIITLVSCGQEFLGDFAVRLKKQLYSFQTEYSSVKEDAKQLFNDVNLFIKSKYKNTNTKEFILSAKVKISDIRELRDSLNAVIMSADFFFATAFNKATSINNNELKEDAIEIIDNQKDLFAKKVKQASGALSSLENLALNVEDILKALEVAGALSIVDDKIIELDEIAKEAFSKMEDIENMIIFGNKLVKSELYDRFSQ
jgi:hypothetical protein